MANPLYERMMQSGMGGVPMASPVPQSPMQRMGEVMQAMSNPQQYLKSRFPDIPDNISNNPAQILQYLQRTRGISNQEIDNLMNQIGVR